MTDLIKKISALLYLNSALFIVIFIYAQTVNCSDWATLTPCVNNALQPFLDNVTSNQESTLFDHYAYNLCTWSSIVEVDDLLTLSSGKGVVIALIDSGIDTGNTMFASAIWENTEEIADDGIDNDGNGYVDDTNGWNFGDANNLVSDLNGHGTNVSGIILKCAPDVKLMILKINPGASSIFYTDPVVDAIYYAVNAGADVINMSLSLAKENDSVKDAIKYAVNQGIMVVASAGNSNNSGAAFPGTMEEVITVGATNIDGTALFWNSPTGSSIDITAPGNSVETVGLGGYTVFVSGTSFSAPMVSGAIAILFGMNHSLKPETVRNLIFNSSRDLGNAGKDDLFGWGILSGIGIVKSATPSIVAIKRDSSIDGSNSNHDIYSSTQICSSKDNTFEISCYLPPTDSLTDIYIALVKNDVPDIYNCCEDHKERPETESIWWLDSDGLWKAHKNLGAISIASLYLYDKAVNILLFGDPYTSESSGGIWRNFSPSGFECGSYRIGIAFMGYSGLLAPISWSEIIF